MTNRQHPSPTQPACARFEERLAAHLEGELDAAARDEMEQHRRACAACARVVRDLKAIVSAAGRLPVLTPSRDLWAGISDRIAAPTVPLFPVEGAPHEGSPASVRRGIAATSAGAAPVRRAVSMRLFAIAATMLIAVSSAVTWRIARTTSSTMSSTMSSATRSDARQAVTDSGVDTDGKLVLVTNPDVVYEREITALRTIVNERFTELDSATVAVLKRNLDIIDKAIDESRQALALDPGSRALSSSLERAVESKLALMRRVALL